MMSPANQEDEFEATEEFDDSVERRQRQTRELTWLFGEEIFEQADQVDIADINMTQEITDAIGRGVKKLKELINDPSAQRTFITSLEPGAQILLCLWIMDMDLLDKIQSHPYPE